MSQPSEPTDKPGPGKPRFLAPIGQARDYVDRPAMSVHTEPECVSDALMNDYAEVNNRIFTQQHALDVALAQEYRPLLKAEDRIRDIHRRAKYAHVDLSHEIHIMRRDLEKSRQRGQEPKPHTLGRLEKIEGLLDGIAA